MNIPLVTEVGMVSVDKTITIHVTNNSNGLKIGGLHLVSRITDGSPVVRIFIDSPAVNLTNLKIEDLIIEGNGLEGDGLVIECARNDSWIYRSSLRDVEVIGCGGNGITVSGSVFESALFNVQAHDNKGSGAVFQHAGGGQVSAISLHGCNFRKNSGWGVQTLNGCRDVKQFGGYYCQNGAGGLNADQGFTLLSGVGFENNNGVAIRCQNYGNCYGCTFSTGGPQITQIDGYLSGHMTLSGIDYEDYGAGTSKLLHVDGTGLLAIDRQSTWLTPAQFGWVNSSVTLRMVP